MITITPNKTIIRKAKLSDLPSIFRMWKKLIQHHGRKAPKQMLLKKDACSIWKKYIKKQIYNKNAQIFVAEFKNKLIAYALFGISKFPTIYVIDKELKVLDVFVEEKFRGKGIAQKLIQEGKKWGTKKGLRYTNLEVFCWNKEAIKAYETAGFKIRRHLMKNY